MIEEISRSAPVLHNIILESRKRLNVTGVRDVSEFNEDKIILNTQLGELTIDGEKLHINQFTQETGELSLEGKVCSLIYSEEPKESGNFLSKLFR